MTRSAQVVHLGEVQTLDAHLVPDAVDMLGPAADLGVHAAGGQRRLQALDGAGDEGFALDPFLFQQARDLLVAVGLQEAERQVFHFPLDLPDAEPVGQRRVRSRVSRANSTEQGVLLSACQRSVRRREASRISTMRRSAAMASSILRCISFANRSRRRRRWRAGPPRPVAAAPRALHQPRHFLAKRGGDRIVAQRRRRRGQVGGQGGQQGRRAWRHRCACRPGCGPRPLRAKPATPGQGLLALEARLGPGHGLVDQRQAVGIQAISRLLPPGSVERRRRVWNGRG